MRARRLRILTLLLALLLVRVAWAQTPIQYVYDQLGRLIAVIDPGGDTAVYHYDAVGNVLSIDRHVTSQVSIISFSPGSGPVGTTVSIYGTGFSATASQDTVTFNGTTATITSATTTKLVATVPTGATTGTIGVTAPGGSATSASSFTVATGLLAPTITSFTPTVGVAGASVTVSGTNFNTVPAHNRLKFNLRGSTASAATATSLTTAVPVVTGSGRITVGTPGGTVVSTADFFVPPSPFTASDVDFTSRMTIGDDKTVTLSTASKIGLVTFDGTGGQRVSLKATGTTMTSAVMSLLNFDNTTRGWVTILAGGTGFLDVLTLPLTSTYAVLVDPNSTHTGGTTLKMYDVPADVTGSIVAGGSNVSVTTTTPGQNARLTFSGTAGQRVSLKATSITMASAVMSILKPDGATLGAITILSGSTGFLDVQTLPVTGTYTVLVDPNTIDTGGATLTLYDVPADVTGSITAGGSSVPVTLTTPGQVARLTFSGTASDRVSLKAASTTIASGTLSLLKPDGTTLASVLISSGSTGFIDVQTLPTTATYTVLVDPAVMETGGTTLTLYSVPADPTGSVTVNGSAVTVTTTQPGQNGSLTFSGTAAQQVAVHWTSNTMGTVFVRLLSTNGTTVLAQALTSASSFDMPLVTLPATGTYTISVDPSSTNIGSITLSVTAATATLVVNSTGPPQRSSWPRARG